MTSSSSADTICVDCGAPVEEHRVRFYAESKIAQEYGLRPSCQACSDAESTRWRTEGLPDLADLHEQRIQNRLRASGLPRPMWDLRISELHSDISPTAIEALTTWARDGGGLYLYGQVGRGKTFMAAAACRAMLEHRAVTWTSVPALIVRYGAAFGDEDRKLATRTLLGTGPLVLDDLGQERPTDAVREQLFAAIDQRYTHQAPLLITSNLKPSDLGRRYDFWLPSRLVEYCRPVEIGGTDRRLKGPRASRNP